MLFMIICHLSYIKKTFLLFRCNLTKESTDTPLLKVDFFLSFWYSLSSNVSTRIVKPVNVDLVGTFFSPHEESVCVCACVCVHVCVFMVLFQMFTECGCLGLYL